MEPAFITIHRADNGLWQAALRTSETGPDIASTDPQHETPADAWSAAFELYRNHLVI
jgi:hypothetical protein